MLDDSNVGNRDTDRRCLRKNCDENCHCHECFCLATSSNSCNSTRTEGGIMVLCLFLCAARELLRSTSNSRSDGHRWRGEKPAVAVHGYIHNIAYSATYLWRFGRAIDACTIYPGGLSLLRRKSACVLGPAEWC